jgi:hypothetical protein
LTLAALTATLPAFGGITYSCNSNIDTLSGTTACETLQTTIAGLYGSTFTNANASIFIQFGNNGGLGASQQFLGAASYASYQTQLASHEGDANDLTAVGTLPGTDPLGSGGNVFLTTALANALGFIDTAGITSSGTSCFTPGVGDCYDGLITLNDPADLAFESGGQGYYYRSGAFGPNNYDFFTVAEHETDEILGTLSCLTTSGGSPLDFCGAGNGAATDLFRYSAPGTRSFLGTANGTLAYFSIDGGTTSIAPYTNSPGIGDYGDWSTGCTHVQDTTGCLGTGFDITNDGGAEISVLDAVGYNLNSSAVPEPATFGLLGVSLVSLALVRTRRRKQK